MKKLGFALSAAVLAASVPAHAEARPEHSMFGTAGPWFGGTGCANHIPFWNKFFHLLGC